jgi:hypothetical protein
MRTDTRAPRTGRLLTMALAILALALPESACGRSESPSEDDHHQSDAAFYQHFAPGDASDEPLLYRSIAEMTKASTVVVRARVTDVVPGRVIKEEAAGRLYMIGVVLAPTENLHGRWSASYQGRLTVEFASGSAPPDREIAELREALPKGGAIWFLQSGADANKAFRKAMEDSGRKLSAQELEAIKGAEPFHAIVATEGLMIQGAKHVETPLRPVEADDGRRPVREEASRAAKLDDVAQLVREVT